METLIENLDIDERWAYVAYTSPKGREHTLFVEFEYDSNVTVEKPTYDYPGSSEISVKAHITRVSAYSENWDYLRQIRPSFALLKALKLDIEMEIEDKYEDKIIEYHEDYQY